jgi:hypothetical protein
VGTGVSRAALSMARTALRFSPARLQQSKIALFSPPTQSTFALAGGCRQVTFEYLNLALDSTLVLHGV